MGINIKNEAVEAMIRELAARRGVSMTEAIRQALSNELAHMEAERLAQAQAKKERLKAIIARTAHLPRLNDLTDDEILGYDEDGLPS